MRKRRQLVLWTLIPLALVGLAVWAWWHTREPVFEGKPISYWLDSARKGLASSAAQRPSSPSSHPVFKAKEACAAIGPEALPCIAARASGEAGPPWRRLYSRFYGYMPSVIGRHLPKPKTERGLGLMLTSGYFLVVTERAGTNALPVLVGLYSSRDPEVRRAVVLSLGRLAALDHARTVPVFQRALRDTAWPVRFDAFRQLCQMAGTDAHVGTILASYLNEAGTNAPDWMRVEGLAAIATGGAANASGRSAEPSVSPATAWEKALVAVAEWQRSPTPGGLQRVLAAFEAAFATSPEHSAFGVRRALENLHLTAQQEREMLVPVLAKGLYSTNVTVRRDAAHMLGELGSAARAAAPLILRAFEQHPSGEFCMLLADLGPQAAPAVSVLVRELTKASDSEVIWEMTYALGKVGPGAKEAGPALLAMAKEKGGDARGYLLSALAQIEPRNPELVPLLLLELNAPDWGDRCRAASMLGDVGSRASNAVPLLKRILVEDEWLGPRLNAATAILRIDGEQARELIPVLTEALQWPEGDGWPTPVMVARLLGQTGDAGRPAIPGLVKLFNHEDDRARIAAAEAVAKLDPARKPECVAVLRHVMAHGQTGLMRFYGAQALLRLAPESSQEVVTAVSGLLKPSTDFYQLAEAAQFLGSIGRPASAALPQLRQALERGDWRLRRAARDAIQRIKTSPGTTSGPS